MGQCLRLPVLSSIREKIEGAKRRSGIRNLTVKYEKEIKREQASVAQLETALEYAEECVATPTNDLAILRNKFQQGFITASEVIPKVVYLQHLIKFHQLDVYAIRKDIASSQSRQLGYKQANAQRMRAAEAIERECRLNLSTSSDIRKEHTRLGMQMERTIQNAGLRLDMDKMVKESIDEQEDALAEQVNEFNAVEILDQPSTTTTTTTTNKLVTSQYKEAELWVEQALASAVEGMPSAPSGIPHTKERTRKQNTGYTKLYKLNSSPEGCDTDSLDL